MSAPPASGSEGLRRETPPDVESENMAGSREVGLRIVAAWRTNNRATTYLVEHVPERLWSSSVPRVPRQTVGRIAAHIHNIRCRWIKALGADHEVVVPRRVDLKHVSRSELLPALAILFAVWASL